MKKEKNKNCSKTNEEIQVIFNKSKILAIFFICLGIFLVLEIALLYAEPFLSINSPWLKGVLKFLSCLSQIGFSIFGVSLLIEYSTLRSISKNSIEEIKNSLVSHTAEAEYIKNTYSNDTRRKLLLMSYMENGEDLDNAINDKDKLSLTTFNDVIKRLITSVYYDKDEMTVSYERQKDYIKKTINRKITIKNLYKKEYTFSARNSYNNIVIDGKAEDSYCITSLSINREKKSADEMNEYVKCFDVNDKETSYKKGKEISISLNCTNEECLVEYTAEAKLPFDDKVFMLHAAVPVRDFSHTIIVDADLNADLTVYSLAKAMKLEGENFTKDLKFIGNKESKIYKIECSSWLFPGDGYTMLLK